MKATLLKNIPWSTVCFLLLATACGGGDKGKSDDDSSKSWRCYEDTSGTCECLGAEWEVVSDTSTEVDACTG